MEDRYSIHWTITLDGGGPAERQTIVRFCCECGVVVLDSMTGEHDLMHDKLDNPLIAVQVTPETTNDGDGMVDVTIHMPEHLHHLLRAHAHAEGISVTEMMRRAVGEHMTASKPPVKKHRLWDRFTNGKRALP